MTGIVHIEAATRKGAHLLIQLFGGPQCGKTHTAMLLARGIAGDKGKVGVIDTESGRARLYSDKIPGGFFVGELTPPFTPQRYQETIEQFVEFGCDVLVIDSFSHVWNGPGGVLELADQGEAAGKKGLQKWLRPKVEYRKMVGFLLSTKIHIIFCSRGKQPVEERIVDGRKTMVTLPWEPIQDKQLKYEMTIVLPMIQDGRFETARDRLKAPVDLNHLFTGEPLTVETGKAIAEWVAGGNPVNHAHELLRKRANDAAMEGTGPLKVFWDGITKAERVILQPGLDNYKSIAKSTDEEKAQAAAIQAENAGDGPQRIPVKMGADMSTDWAAWSTEAKAAVAGAPTLQWLADWEDKHSAALSNLGKEDGAKHAEVVAAIAERKMAMKEAA